MSKSEIDQTKDGIIAITVCIAQILTESDPTFAARLEARLGAWSGALTEFGEWDEGPSLKRFMARAKGRGTRILKRTSHITVVVGEGK